MKTLLIVSMFVLTGCESYATRMEKADANRFDYYQSLNDGGVDKEKAYAPPDRNYLDYFSCLARYNQRFNEADARYICQ